MIGVVKKSPPAKKPGRQTISPDGERMKQRVIRMTDAEWAGCLEFGGSQFVRDAANRAIARRRAAQKRGKG